MKHLFFICLFFVCTQSVAQTPSWAFNLGSAGNDLGYSCAVAPNGNIYITGRFTGTIDLDPGSGVYNVVSNGLDDIFLACYTPAGAIIWGIRIGGPSYDAGMNLAVDGNNDVTIVGYFRGTNVDFDPGPGTFLLSDAGVSGPSTIMWDGDGFVAKFSSAGVFQWAKALGGPYVYDCTFDVATDALRNVYVTGFFTSTMVVSPTLTWNSATTGKGYIIKSLLSGKN